MKKILLLFCILIFIAASVYFYITTQEEATTPPTSTPTVFIDKHWDSDNNSITRRSMPQDCYSKDSPECYSRNYNDVVGTNSTTCICDIEFDGKKYHETFTIDINYKYKELIGMKSFSETKFLSKVSDMYCDFVCDEFSNQIKNNTYIEMAK